MTKQDGQSHGRRSTFLRKQLPPVHPEFSRKIEIQIFTQPLLAFKIWQQFHQKNKNYLGPNKQIELKRTKTSPRVIHGYLTTLTVNFGTRWDGFCRPFSPWLMTHGSLFAVLGLFSWLHTRSLALEDCYVPFCGSKTIINKS